jgi:hypothetical protein
MLALYFLHHRAWFGQWDTLTLKVSRRMISGQGWIFPFFYWKLVFLGINNIFLFKRINNHYLFSLDYTSIDLKNLKKLTTSNFLSP